MKWNWRFFEIKIKLVLPVFSKWFDWQLEHNSIGVLHSVWIVYLRNVLTLHHETCCILYKLLVCNINIAQYTVLIYNAIVKILKLKNDKLHYYVYYPVYCAIEKSEVEVGHAIVPFYSCTINVWCISNCKREWYNWLWSMQFISGSCKSWNSVLVVRQNTKIISSWRGLNFVTCAESNKIRWRKRKFKKQEIHYIVGQ